MPNEMILAGGAYLARPGSGKFDSVSEEEAAALIAAAPTSQTRLLLRMLWSTGARISEVLALHVGDVDARKSEVRIQRLKRRRPFVQAYYHPPDADLRRAME